MKTWLMLAIIVYCGLTICNFIFYLDIVEWKIFKFNYKQFIKEQFYLFFIVFTFPFSIIYLKETNE